MASKSKILEIDVSISLEGSTTSVGTLRCVGHSAEFKYHEQWLQHSKKSYLEPSFRDVGIHRQYLFGALGDSAPDHWGRLLIKRYSNKTGLDEIDFLLAVNSEARLGAISFSCPDYDYAFGERVRKLPMPSVDDLDILLPLVDKVIAASEISAEYLQLLLAPGSSLGGAKPKVAIKDRDGCPAMVKFPGKNDIYDVVRWEFVALEISALAGVATSVAHIEEINDRSALVVKRFDRKHINEQQLRVPFLSALGMIRAYGQSMTYSYLDIVAALQQHGANPDRDLPELWRRMVLTIMISNTDDHLRNHGFLYQGGAGWNLSPVYDINPNPTGRHLCTAIDEHSTEISLDNAMKVAKHFRLDSQQATAVAEQVRDAVSQWRKIAKDCGISPQECDRMAPAFQHAA